MKLEDVKISGGELNPIRHEVVSDVEARLNITFPLGYREFITTLGQGFFCESYIRVYPPRRILKEYRDFQKRWAEYWFWDDGRDVLSKAKALQAIIIADTMEGDELIFCPDEPERLYVLPRNKDTIFQVGTTLFEALEWLCHSGILIEPMQDNTFEPFELEW
jgi:hypothetical protein